MNKSDILILGGGIAGLTYAYQAQSKGARVQLLEATDRVGGAIQSEQKEGYLLEFGPNTVLPNAELWDLINQVGLQEEVTLSQYNTPRYILRHQQLHAVPMSPPALFKTKLLSPWGKMRLLAEPLIPKKKTEEEETLCQFMGRRLGKQISERLIKPFVSGVWAGDGDQLSAHASFPRLVNWEKTKGSILKGAMSELRNKKKSKGEKKAPPPRGLLSFSGGLQTFSSTLRNKLGDSVLLNQKAKQISHKKDSQGQPEWTIRTKDQTFMARKVILALPAQESAKILFGFAPQAAHVLSEIPYASVVLLHLAIPKTGCTQDCNGFGFLTTPGQNKGLLGCLWTSSLFEGRAPQEQNLLTVFLGGACHPDLINKSDNHLIDDALQELQDPLGFKEKPTVLSLRRYPLAIPQYTLGHQKREEVLVNLEKEFPSLKFIGNIRGGISVGDVVKNAMKDVMI